MDMQSKNGIPIFMQLRVNGSIEYRIFSNIPAAGLAFQPKKNAGLLERWVYWRGGIIFSMPWCLAWGYRFTNKRLLKIWLWQIRVKNMQFEEGSKRMFQKNDKAQALYQACQF